MMTGGFFGTLIQGSGTVALTSHGQPSEGFPTATS